jgi:translation elongation factor P/translation initiation factor 5A
MTFRIIDDKTNKVLYETDSIVDFMDEIEKYEYVEDRPMVGFYPKISEYGEKMRDGY